MAIYDAKREWVGWYKIHKKKGSWNFEGGVARLERNVDDMRKAG